MNGFQGDENAEKFCSKLWSISYVNLHAWNNTLSFILMQIGYDRELVFDIVLDIIILKMKDKNRLEPYWRYWHVMKASNNSERRKENSIIRFRILCSICPSFLTSDWVYTLQTHTLIDCHSCLLQTLFCWLSWNMELHSNWRLILFHYFDSTLLCTCYRKIHSFVWSPVDSTCSFYTFKDYLLRDHPPSTCQA